LLLDRVSSFYPPGTAQHSAAGQSAREAVGAAHRFSHAVLLRPPSIKELDRASCAGKTLLARAVANRTDACFIRVIGSELVQKYVGEGARMVSRV
jgi:ATP-dependent 26S proteasome regulatory subunit